MQAGCSGVEVGLHQFGDAGEGCLVVGLELEADREAEAERFTAAAATVADRLAARSVASSGLSAEVLQAAAVLARDRGLLASVKVGVKAGAVAPHPVYAAVDQFTGLFGPRGGLMAERVTDLYDLRDRIVAELTGQSEPGIPTPAELSVLLDDDLAPPAPPAWTRHG